MTINNSKQEMTSEYRQLQYELQCQEALLVLMQKLKTNQRLASQTNQKTSTPTPVTPVNPTTKSNSTPSIKQSLVNNKINDLINKKNKQTNLFFFRIQQIVQSQQNHLIQINIQ